MGWIRAAGLGKRFKHYGRSLDRVWEWAGAAPRHRSIWALRGVDLAIEPGEAVAVVGANGSGKSTLLKLVKGTLRPSAGTVSTTGRLAALELGLGFHPEFTGRENALTGGTLLGLERRDVAARIDAIASFAELGAHLDEPMRTYSSGMQLRLAFSVATAVRPDVLLIDEALAVGDAYFQQKCMARIREFRRAGTTLVLVSHDPQSVKTLCDRALLLDDGLLVRTGAPVEVLEYYNAMIARRRADEAIRQGEALGQGSTRSGDGRAAIERVELRGESGATRAFRVGGTMIVEVAGHARAALHDLTVGISIRDRTGTEVFGTNTRHLGVRPPALLAGAPFRAEFRLPANLGIGSYSVTAALHAGTVHLEGSYDWWDQVRTFQVLPADQPPFVGCAYLPVSAQLETGAAPERVWT